MPVVVVDEAEFGVIILAGPLDGLFHITCRGYLPIGGVGIGGDGFGCDHHLAILHLGADAFHQFVGGVVAIGGGDAVLIGLRELAAAHPRACVEAAIAAGGLHYSLLGVVLISGGGQQQPLRAVPDALLLEGDGIIRRDELLRLPALSSHQRTGGHGGGVLVHGAVLRGGFVVMPGLHPVDLLAELRLARCIRVLRSFAVAFLNRNLLVAYPSGVGGGRCAFYRGRLLIGVVDDLDIEPAGATGTSRKLDTMRLKYQHVILILSKKGERILRPRGACKPAAYGAI